MKRKQALNLLGLEKTLVDLTPEIVGEAFRTAVRANHPDSKSDSNLHPAIDLRDSSRANMDDLTIAKETLLQHLKGDDFACKLCRGTGKVPSKMGLRSCVACSGTGDRR